MQVAHNVGATPPRRGVHFIPPQEVSDVAAELERSRFVVARVALTSATGGKLAALIDEAVESALATRGALPMGLDASSGVDIASKLLRTRTLPAPGLVLCLPNLRAMADVNMRLEGADAESLRAWMRASQHAEVILLLEEIDRSVELVIPASLSDMARGSATDAPVATSAVSRGAASVATTANAPVLAQAVMVPPKGITKPPMVRSGNPPELRVAEAKPQANRVVQGAEWRNLAVQLHNASGPQPPKEVERLFRSHYMPLLGASLRGELDGAIEKIMADWALGFRESYGDHFSALGATPKRPNMVLDVPQIAGRIARLSGARAHQLFLVDALRYDLGEALHQTLERLLAGCAICVEKQLLWAALPTTTPNQLRLLARGPEGLREPPPSERDLDVNRNRAVSTVRRVRIGHRDLLKVDLVEARLRAPGLSWEERKDSIVAELGHIVANVASGLAPRTLLMVFGDHGFRFDRERQTTTEAVAQGGAHPEEVLVPAYAWLVGGVH